MGQVFKRDWEIVRIFLILAILTVGFVLGMQSLILTPTGPSRSVGAVEATVTSSVNLDGVEPYGAILSKVPLSGSSAIPSPLVPKK
jgi:hypothetical protein